MQTKVAAKMIESGDVLVITFEIVGPQSSGQSIHRSNPCPKWEPMVDRGCGVLFYIDRKIIVLVIKCSYLFIRIYFGSI